MANIEGHGRPTKRTAAAVGDLYVDIDTGRMYECISADTYSQVHGDLMGGYIWKYILDVDYVIAADDSIGPGSGSGSDSNLVIVDWSDEETA